MLFSPDFYFLNYFYKQTRNQRLASLTAPYNFTTDVKKPSIEGLGLSECVWKLTPKAQHQFITGLHHQPHAQLPF